MKSRSALITAHPGHELLLHRWLEIEQPLVFALTDGSGARGASRIARSRKIIAGTGACCAQSFGLMPDHVWYAAILAGDLTPFLDAIAAISGALPTPIDTIVVDAIEHYNPMHDLAAVVGAVVARRIDARQVLCYPIEQEEISAPPVREIHLNDAEMDRKMAAAQSYLELTAEVDAFSQRSSQARCERLHSLDLESSLPEQLAARPYYEIFGETRINEGRFSELITYQGHVRPLARRIQSSAR